MKSHPKKILLYTDTTLIGGAENHMLNLVRFLDRGKFMPIMMCCGHKNLDEWSKKIRDTGTEVIRLIATGKHNPRHYSSLKETLEDLEIDLLHAHIWNPASGRYAYLAAKTTKKPLLTTEHDPFLLSPIKNRIKKWLLKNTDHVIAISEANKNFLQNAYESLRGKISMIHNGIDITWFESQLLSFSKTAREQFRKEHFDADKKTPVIACVAELHPRKGLLHLIEAAKILQEKLDDFRIVIAGKGAQEKVLKEKIKKLGLEKEVQLTGYQKNIPQFLAASDLFVLPSLNEAFGLAILEAMAAKLPVIGTKNGGIPEIITNNVNGLLVPPKDSRNLAYAMLRLINNKELASRLGEKGYENVKKMFDVKIMVKKTEEVYSNLLK